MYAVMEANGLTDANFIYVGQELIISGAAAPELPRRRRPQSNKCTSCRAATG